MKKKSLEGLPYILISVLGVFVFYLLPILDSVRRSLLSSNGKVFVGIKNYISLLKDDLFILSIKNTLSLILFVIIPIVVTSLLLANMLVSMKRFGIGALLVLFIPFLIPNASVSFICKILFSDNGIINGFLAQLNINANYFLSSHSIFVEVAVMFAWRYLGVFTLLWFFGIRSVETQQIEAAIQMGSSGLRLLWDIILPNMKFTVFLISCLSFITIFDVQKEVYTLANELPPKAVFFAPHLFTNYFTKMEFGKLAASSSIVALVFLGAILSIYNLLEQED